MLGCRFQFNNSYLVGIKKQKQLNPPRLRCKILAWLASHFVDFTFLTETCQMYVLKLPGYHAYLHNCHLWSLSVLVTLIQYGFCYITFTQAITEIHFLAFFVNIFNHNVSSITQLTFQGTSLCTIVSTSNCQGNKWAHILYLIHTFNWLVKR